MKYNIDGEMSHIQNNYPCPLTLNIVDEIFNNVQPHILKDRAMKKRDLKKQTVRKIRKSTPNVPKWTKSLIPKNFDVVNDFMEIRHTRWTLGTFLDQISFDIFNNHQFYSHSLNSKHSRFSDLDSRIKTFLNPLVDWPGMVDYKYIAEAGFYYTGYLDICCCHHCGLMLHDFKIGDNIYIDHLLHGKECVLLYRTLKENNDLLTKYITPEIGRPQYLEKSIWKTFKVECNENRGKIDKICEFCSLMILRKYNAGERFAHICYSKSSVAKQVNEDECDVCIVHRNKFLSVDPQIGFTIEHRLELPLVNELVNALKDQFSKIQANFTDNIFQISWYVANYIIDMYKDLGNKLNMLRHTVNLLFGLGFPSILFEYVQQVFFETFSGISKQFSIDNEFQNKLAKCVFVICSLWAYKCMPGRQDIDTFLRRLDLFPKAITGLSTFLITMSGLFDKVWNFLAQKHLGLESIELDEKLMPEKLITFSKDIQAISEQITKTDYAIKHSTVENIRRLYKLSNEILHFLTTTKADKTLFDFWRVHHNQLDKIKLEASRSGANFLTIRTKPMCIQIFGEPGQGKSELIYPLVQDLWALECSEQSDYNPLEFEKQLYQRRVTNEYWDGYMVDGQAPYGVSYDDFGTKKDTTNNPNPEFEEVLNAVGETPYQLHMSDIANKQNTYFTSRLLVLASNKLTYPINSMTNPDALSRRIHVTAEVEVKSEYLMEYVDDEGHKKKQVNPLLVDQGKGFNADIYKISIVNRLGQIIKAPNGLLLEDLSYNEFVAYCNVVREQIRTSAENKRVALMDRAKMLKDSSRNYLNKFHEMKDKYVDPQMFIPSFWFSEIQENTKDLVTRVRNLGSARTHPPVDEIIGEEEYSCFYSKYFDEVTFYCKYSNFWSDFKKDKITLKSQFKDIWKVIAEKSSNSADYMNEQFALLGIDPYNWFETARVNVQCWYDECCMDFEIIKKKVKEVFNKIPFKPIFVMLTSVITAISGVFAIYTIGKNLFHAGVKQDNVNKLPLDEKKESKSYLSPKLKEWFKDKFDGFPLFQRNGPRTLELESKPFNTPSLPRVIVNSKPFNTPSLPKVVINSKPFNTPSLPKNIIESEFCVDNNTEQILRSVLSRNMYTMNIHIGENEDYHIRTLQGTFIKGRILLTNRHFLECALMSKRITLKSLFAREPIEVCFDDLEITPIRSNPKFVLSNDPAHKFKDAILIKFPRNIPQHRDITKFFFKRSDQASFYDAQSALYVVNEFTQRVNNQTIETPILVAKYGQAYAHDKHLDSQMQKDRIDSIPSVGFKFNLPSVYLDNERSGLWQRIMSIIDKALNDRIEVTFKTRDYYSYDFDTNPGDCGSLLCIREPSAARKIMGMHFAGSQSMFGTVCNYSIAITQEDLNDTISTMSEIDALMEPKMPVGVGFNELENLEIKINNDESVILPFTTNRIPEAMVFPQGSVTTTVRQVTTTKLRKSKIHGLMLPVTTKPAHLQPIQVGDKMVDPMLKGIQKVARSPAPLPDEFVEYATRSYFEDKISITTEDITQYARVLTNEEAIIGVENVPFLEPIKRTTSAGYPWTQLLTVEDKSPWLGKDEIYIVDNPALKRELKAREDANRKGERYPTIWTDTLKDERRPIVKVDEGKTRVFTASPMDFSILFRKYYLGFMGHVMCNRNLNGVSVGTNPFGGDWNMLEKHLRSKGKCVIAGDFENFDGTLSAVIIWKIVKYINLWYKENDKNWTIEDDNCRLALCAEVVNSVHINRDVIYGWFLGLTSGCPATAIWNSIYNNVAMLMVYLIQAPQEMRSASKFFDLVFMVAYGDDNVLNIHESIIDWFNMTTISKGFEEIGMKYTDELKTGKFDDYKTLEEVKYLKRSFYHDDMLGMCLGQLDLEVIMEMPNWIRGDLSPVECTKIVCETALQELSLYPSDIFEYNKDIIVNACKKVGIHLQGMRRYDLRMRLLDNMEPRRN